MEKTESIEDFYKTKFDWMPENFKNEIGHFNVFNLEPFVGEKAQPVPYKRRDFYKIMLVKGNSKVHYADKVVEVKKQALSFSNPQIPYKWEHLDNISEGSFCIFNQHFFHQYGNLNQYSVFQPNGTHIFELTDEQVEKIAVIYKRMFEEINSEYVYKYDVLRNLVFELLHFAMKMDPSANIENQQLNASQRISTLFLELLERQFPIDDTNQKVHFRTASDFANQLNIHVNHLNKAVKETTQKTTSQIIAERVLQESKILLKHSNWNVSEIAYALGFTEVTNFNNFFKKHLQLSPLKFRNL
ncbi:helix-turn-helix domain-containing protein [Flavobacterium gawalongense]|uniref:Helix-turn-helix domain-containing protein n=1 Tax=Flavobacterium gawalongense TaxID=2594432 RepID=A0A553BW96_9FLAO|nr:helix-turn-helix transcriptional regulator [Flavobacterium gawalongense]TRX01996.1 helix-turn-helix domain-containing protein [Flavobacterium gawalongense]TRX06524.1 helix-turn-helix domain-containing protein [Flavobacterium gawalongense]TRX12550.1 helix-turn-helix domain-containing protein [Flavobacterium gawalongense]TRX12629.1 helix-turn-helix domain-containing protein [Flavobacterium gawalongense]TRX30582.1 helix-turn-helix domain-containing protein [Flavobacterium gawalongense]